MVGDVGCRRQGWKRVHAMDCMEAVVFAIVPRTSLKVVLDFAEIADCKHVQDHEVSFVNVVDLVPGITRDEQHSSRVDVMHDIINGDCSAS
jgi:hypothetical protein